MEHISSQTTQNLNPHLTEEHRTDRDGFVTVPKTWMTGLVEWAKRMEERERHVLVGVLYKLELNHLLRYILDSEPEVALRRSAPEYKVLLCDRCADKYLALEGGAHSDTEASSSPHRA